VVLRIVEGNAPRGEPCSSAAVCGHVSDRNVPFLRAFGFLTLFLVLRTYFFFPGVKKKKKERYIIGDQL
jgi:hypothetical protein